MKIDSEQLSWLKSKYNISYITYNILVNVKGRNFRKFLIALQLIMFKMNLSDIWHLKIEGYTLSEQLNYIEDIHNFNSIN